jgi:membrane protein implicated in regulation of membrane protease activity
MKKSDSIFTSFGFTLVMSVLAIVMLANYTRLVVDGITPLRIFGLVAWVFMAVYFIRTFLARARERRQAQSE